MSKLIIEGLLYSWVITRFKPLEMVLDLLPDYLLFNLIRLLMTCFMCVSFWLSLVIWNDIYLSCMVAFCAFWYDKLIGFYENRVRLN